MKLLHTYLIGLTLLFSTFVHATDSATDWRQTASTAEKVNNLTQVMPGASTIMLQMGERYKNLYWAANLGKWEFSEYQLEEMEELVKTLMITRPARAKTAKDFLDSGLQAFPDAFKNKDWKTFQTAFEQMRSHCMVCHIRNDHGFVTLPMVPKMGNSIVLEVKP